MLLDKVAKIEDLTTVEEVWDHTLDALSGAGIAHVIYISVNEHRREPFVLTNVPDVYATSDPTTDPFLSHICTSYDIVPTGPAYLSNHAYLPDDAKAFIMAASATGWQTGMGIPMRLQGSDRYGGFNLGSSKSREDFEATVMPHAELFRTFCLLVHRRIEEIMAAGALLDASGFRDLLVAPQAPALSILSPREREVIYLISRGVSRKECARLCGISPHTVADYTKSAYRKLGVQNRVEAAALVLRALGDRAPG